MKLFKSCPILTGIVIITSALTVISYASEDMSYSEYTEGYDVSRTPHFTFVFRGLRDGILPFSKQEAEEDLYVSENEETDTTEAAEPENTVTEVIIVEEEPEEKTETADISGNSENGDDISGNDADKTYEFTPVSEDYFDDALFIGDSRTVGLSEYCPALDERATFYAKVSLTIYDCMKKPFVKADDGKITVEQALSENQFGKIYIMLGLNEIGTGTAETFLESYKEVVDRIRELQPDAMIFIQGIMHVTEHKHSQDKYFNNDNINARNEAISTLADNKNIFYIDMNEATDDENGNLLSKLSFDDVHLKASSYERWYLYLLEHGIIKD